MVNVHISAVQNFPKWHSKRVEMTVQGVPDCNNITREIADAILQATIPTGIDNPNTVVQGCVYPVDGPAFYFKRYKRGPLLVGDLENDLVEELLDGQFNLFQNSRDFFQFNAGKAIVVSFYYIPDIEALRRGREEVNLTLY